MRRLFLRIFLLFSLAMAAVATVLIVSSPFFTRSRPGVERWQRDVEGGLRDRVERHAHLIEHGERETPAGERPAPGDREDGAGRGASRRPARADLRGASRRDGGDRG